MNNTHEIERLYRSYLQTDLDTKIGLELCQALNQIGLKDESHALEIYFEKGRESPFNFQSENWHGHRCFVGSNLPSKAEIGDLWFDVVELTPMILIPISGHSSFGQGRWISTHPVYMWQFKTFLTLVEWRLIRKYFMNVTDLLRLDRFDSMNGMGFVTNIYHEEAVAYAHWFGKYLCGGFDLQSARDYLKPEELSNVLPSGIRLWEGAEFPLSEFVRIAVGRENIDKDPDEEYELVKESLNESIPDRMIFNEWDRMPDIGLSTKVSTQVGLIKDLPRMAYEFIEMLNCAPRP